MSTTPNGENIAKLLADLSATISRHRRHVLVREYTERAILPWMNAAHEKNTDLTAALARVAALEETKAETPSTDAIRRELEQLGSPEGFLPVDYVLSKYAALEEANRGMAEDNARIDWIESKRGADFLWMSPGHSGPDQRPLCWVRGYGQSGHFHTIRQAIDAARGSEAKA